LSSEVDSVKLVKSGLIVALLTLAGRLAGLVREVALAGTVGIGSDADVAVLLLTLPDFLTQVLAAGAINTVLVPVFNSMASPRECAAHFRTFTGWALMLGCGLALAIWAGAPGVVLMLAPGLTDGAFQRAVLGVGFVAWTLPLTAATAVTGAWLNSQSRFGVATAGTLVGNTILIVVLLGWPRSIVALGIGLLAVSGARWFSQIAALRYPVWHRTEEPSPLPEGLTRRYIDAAATAAVVFAAPLVLRALASLDGAGSVATLTYATRVLDVPMGLALGVVPIVVFPRLTAAYVAGDPNGFRQFLSTGLLSVLALSLPVAAGLAFFGDVAARLLFAFVEVEASAIEGVAAVIRTGAWGLPAVAVSALLQCGLTARLDTRSPFFGTGFYLLVLIVAGGLAVMESGLTRLMAVASVSQWLLALVLFWHLQTIHGVSGLSRGEWVTTGWLVAATGAGYAVPVWWSWGVIETAPRLAAGALGGLLALALVTWVMRARVRL
jgi:murein biosynthesis integral membrane protein MurJ